MCVRERERGADALESCGLFVGVVAAAAADAAALRASISCEALKCIQASPSAINISAQGALLIHTFDSCEGVWIFIWQFCALGNL